MTLTDDQVLELCREAGFKIFKNRIVAADGGSSGEATQCARKLVELVLALQQETQLHPEDYPVPRDYDEQGRLLQSLEQRTQELADGVIEGALLSFSAADGYAYYVVHSAKPLVLQHVPLFDAYRVLPSTVRGLRVQDIERMVDAYKARHKRFGPKATHAF